MTTPQGTAARAVIPIAPVTESGELVSLYEKQRTIYPRSVHGWFSHWRWAMVWLTQLVFYGLPWITLNGRQAVLFELTSRRFYIFELVLYPQDFIYLTGHWCFRRSGSSSSPPSAGGCGAATPARKRFTARSSCGSSGASKANAARA